MIKVNKNKAPMILLVIFLISSLFYWFQYRPATIRHDCSWVKKHKNAVSARYAQTIYDVPKTTLDDLKKKNTIDKCAWESGSIGLLNEWLDHGKECQDKNNIIIRDLKIMMPAEQAKNWWIKATKEQYQFCLHDKGL